MANDILNKSGKTVYASYDAHGTYIVIKISKDLEPSICVLASNFKDKDKKDFDSLSELCEYFGTTPCLDDWTGSYEMDCSKTKFSLAEVLEFKLLDNEDSTCTNDGIEEFFGKSDSDDGDCYYTEMTTTHADKDTYITEVPPLQLSDDTMKRQAEYTANAVGSALEKLQNNKKNKNESTDTSIYTEESVKYTIDDFNKVVQGVDADGLSRILHIKGALLLVSPPGTGKTTTAIELAKYIQGETESGRVTVLSFSQTTSYSDFIGGYRKNDEGDWELQKGNFFEVCEKACKDLGNKYILIIDEINRGNTESIFGEAMSGISQRGKKFKTNIGLDIEVPENVYIIATMNSTDSSITSLDTALVDRFSVYSMPEIELNTKKLGSKQKEVAGVDLVSKAIKDINTILAQDVYKGKDNRIGNRALFTNYSSVRDLILVVKYDIQPKVEAKLNTLTKQAQDEIKDIFDKLLKELNEAR